jgi:signal transduction histidine kinase
MRSVYAKVVIWCFGTLFISLIAFSFITTVVRFHLEGRGGMMPRVDAMVLDQARDAYEKGGPSALEAYLAMTRRFLQGRRYLVDAYGKDLITADDRSTMLTAARREWGAPHKFGSDTIVVQSTPDDRYRLIAVLDPPPILWNLTPYYLMILAAVGALCWALAFSIASPLRKLSKVVERFGRGDLNARASLPGRDEIGELAQAFDQMAERIGTLLEAERRLLQDVSHELRAPLARMSFAAELIRTADDREAAVARLKKEIGRLSSLIGTLLQMTSAEGDPATRNREIVSLNGLLREIVEDCWVEADARRCRLLLFPNAEVVNVGDRDLLRRAIENVVLNAIRYTPKGSPVEITLDTSGPIATIRIRDYGLGVPEKALQKIFSPFFRVDNSRDSSTGGIGLGLAIARRAIALHHGRVWAENVQPGLAVSIEIPAGVGALADNSAEQKSDGIRR